MIGLPTQLINDLDEALTASEKDPCTGLELLAHVVLTAAEACVAGETACVPAHRESVAALQDFLLGLVHAPPDSRQCDRLAGATAVWDAVAAAMSAVYGVDDSTLATAVLRGWRRCAAALLAPRRRRQGRRRTGGIGGAGGTDAEALEDGSEGEEEKQGHDDCCCVRLPAPAALTTDPRVVDDVLGRCVGHARALAPLGGLAARLVSLLRGFQTCCGVNACHDGDPLRLLVLWLHVMLHAPPPPPKRMLPRNAAAEGQQQQEQEQQEREEEMERRVLAEVCGDVYPLSAAAMEHWAAAHHRHVQLLLRRREEEEEKRAQDEQRRESEGAQAVAAGEDGGVGGGRGGGGPDEEPLGPPALFFQLLLAVLQDGAADGVRWSPHTAAALEQTCQQIFALLRGGSETYSACWAAFLAGAEESLAAVIVIGGAAVAAEWSAEPGVSRALDLMRSYGGLSLVVRAALARAGDNRRKVSALMSVLTAMCRPSSEAAPAPQLPRSQRLAAAGSTARRRSGGGEGHNDRGGEDGGSEGVGVGVAVVSYSGAHPMARLVSLSCEMLLPESNCPVEVRVAALQALCSALEEHLAFLDEQKQKERDWRRRRCQTEQRRRQPRGGAGGGGNEDASEGDGTGSEGDGGQSNQAADGGESGGGGGRSGGGSGRQAALLWSPESVDALFFCLLHDPSIRVRRAAMRLVSLVVLPAGGDGADRLSRTLLTKLRDTNALVSDRALELLVQLPFPLIARAVATAAAAGPHQQPGCGGRGGGGSGGGISWAAIVQHCIAGLAAAAAEDGGGGGGRRALSCRAENCGKLLRVVAEAAVAEAAAASAGAVRFLHPLELLLQPAMLAGGGQAASDAAIAALLRAEVAFSESAGGDT